MRREDFNLAAVLRRALGRAGIVKGYEHVCRRPACGHKVMADDKELRRCPDDNSKLWPKAIVRQIRFHDLRHTTASLLMMAGANPASVQRIMRHSNPKMTTEVYGHLAPEYLQTEVDRFTFKLPDVDAHDPSSTVTKVSEIGKKSPPFAAGLLLASENHLSTPKALNEMSLLSQGFEGMRPAGLEPTTPGLEGRCSIQLSYGRSAYNTMILLELSVKARNISFCL